MIVVDSSVWIDYFNGRINPETDALDSLLSGNLLLTGDLILAEVLQGFRTDAAFRKASELLDQLIFADMVGRTVALAGARMYRSLRRRGVTVRSTVDLLIGAFCIENGHSLLHRDSDFTPLERHFGLKRVRT